MDLDATDTGSGSEPEDVAVEPSANEPFKFDFNPGKQEQPKAETTSQSLLQKQCHDKHASIKRRRKSKSSNTHEAVSAAPNLRQLAAARTSFLAEGFWSLPKGYQIKSKKGKKSASLIFTKLGGSKPLSIVDLLQIAIDAKFTLMQLRHPQWCASCINAYMEIASRLHGPGRKLLPDVEPDVGAVRKLLHPLVEQQHELETLDHSRSKNYIQIITRLDSIYFKSFYHSGGCRETTATSPLPIGPLDYLRRTADPPDVANKLRETFFTTAVDSDTREEFASTWGLQLPGP